MIIEIGKYYVTRGHYLAQIFAHYKLQEYPYIGALLTMSGWQDQDWRKNGRYYNDRKDSTDLCYGPFNTLEEAISFLMNIENNCSITLIKSLTEKYAA